MKQPQGSGRRVDDWLQAVDAVLADCDAGENQVRTATEQPELLGKLWGRFRKERDLELHVRTGWRFGTQYVQLLDFVPSRGEYENEVLIEAALLPLLHQQLGGLLRHCA